ncbi:MAG: hypothetical protein H7326_02065 [Bdellovibrionaceae bacterium]|nr:hypothetical protein [Pseudobdellovibrionaceae bacterium]
MYAPPKNSFGVIRFLFVIGLSVGYATVSRAQTAADVQVEIPPASAAAQAKMQLNSGATVPVELEWEKIPGAKRYELEFQDLNGKLLHTFKSESNIFKFKFRVGKYFVRSRVSDSRAVFGEWSGTNEFVVQPKPAFVGEKSVRTSGKINPKTLTSEVFFHWSEAPGASFFKVKIVDQTNTLIREAIVKGFSYKTELKAGVYTTTLTSVNDKGIESEPVVLPGKVVIETVQLPKPEIVFEEFQDPANAKLVAKRLPQTNGVATLRWKPTSLSDTVGLLEYRYFFGEEWIPVHNFNSKSASEVILEKSQKPGRYRITVWAEAAGLVKSEPTSYEFVTKPAAY